ncbi:MAG: HEAT repeat domain-containing protein [Planctomycetes bacterium]|nr:HEAT repeat domain-containing protein [Planctomycetota bacterium]
MHESAARPGGAAGLQGGAFLARRQRGSDPAERQLRREGAKEWYLARVERGDHSAYLAVRPLLEYERDEQAGSLDVVLPLLGAGGYREDGPERQVRLFFCVPLGIAFATLESAQGRRETWVFLPLLASRERLRSADDERTRWVLAPVATRWEVANGDVDLRVGSLGSMALLAYRERHDGSETALGPLDPAFGWATGERELLTDVHLLPLVDLDRDREGWRLHFPILWFSVGRQGPRMEGTGTLARFWPLCWREPDGALSLAGSLIQVRVREQGHDVLVRALLQHARSGGGRRLAVGLGLVLDHRTEPGGRWTTLLSPAGLVAVDDAGDRLVELVQGRLLHYRRTPHGYHHRMDLTPLVSYAEFGETRWLRLAGFRFRLSRDPGRTLARGLEDWSPARRILALRRLEASGDTAWFATVLEAVDDPDPEVRLVATSAALVLAPVDRSLVAEMLRHLDHPDPHVRSGMALLLGRLADPASGAALRALGTDPDPEVAQAARWSLARVTTGGASGPEGEPGVAAGLSAAAAAVDPSSRSGWRAMVASMVERDAQWSGFLAEAVRDLDRHLFDLGGGLWAIPDTLPRWADWPHGLPPAPAAEGVPDE